MKQTSWDYYLLVAIGSAKGDIIRGGVLGQPPIDFMADNGSSEDFISAKIAQLGHDGWELVSVGQGFYYFKRPGDK